jgi:hypothetical protein
MGSLLSLTIVPESTNEAVWALTAGKIQQHSSREKKYRKNAAILINLIVIGE